MRSRSRRRTAPSFPSSARWVRCASRLLREGFAEPGLVEVARLRAGIGEGDDFAFGERGRGEHEIEGAEPAVAGDDDGDRGSRGEAGKGDVDASFGHAAAGDGDDLVERVEA